MWPFTKDPSFLSFSGFLNNHSFQSPRSFAYTHNEKWLSQQEEQWELHLRAQKSESAHEQWQCFLMMLTAFNCSSRRFSRPSLFKAASSFLIDFNTCFRRARRTGFGSQGLISQTWLSFFCEIFMHYNWMLYCIKIYSQGKEGKLLAKEQ